MISSIYTLEVLSLWTARSGKKVKCHTMCRMPQPLGAFRDVSSKSRHFQWRQDGCLQSHGLVSPSIMEKKYWPLKLRTCNSWIIKCFLQQMCQDNHGDYKVTKWKDEMSRRLVAAFRMKEMMTHPLMKHRLRWLGHLAHMEPCHLPK